jgi:hypothetical protein
MQAMEFGRLAAERGYLGLEWERFRKVARVLQRTPEVVKAGFEVLTDNPVQRGYGGAEIGAVDIAFLVFAALLGGAINEDLGRRTWIAYSAPGQNFRHEIETKTRAGRKRYMTELHCPVTGHNRAGDVVRDILAFPDLAAQVLRLSLWREAHETHVLWRGDPPRMSFFAPEQNKAPSFWTEASMSGETLLAIAEATKGQHPVAWQRRDN